MAIREVVFFYITPLFKEGQSIHVLLSLNIPLRKKNVPEYMYEYHVWTVQCKYTVNFMHKCNCTCWLWIRGVHGCVESIAATRYNIVTNSSGGRYCFHVTCEPVLHRIIYRATGKFVYMILGSLCKAIYWLYKLPTVRKYLIIKSKRVSCLAVCARYSISWLAVDTLATKCTIDNTLGSYDDRIFS